VVYRRGAGDAARHGYSQYRHIRRSGDRKTGAGDFPRRRAPVGASHGGHTALSENAGGSKMGAMTLPLTGGCQCGALRYDITAAPSMTYTCHCTDCQQLTSSAFSLAITVPDSTFRLTKGETRQVQAPAARG